MGNGYNICRNETFEKNYEKEIDKKDETNIPMNKKNKNSPEKTQLQIIISEQNSLTTNKTKLDTITKIKITNTEKDNLKSYLIKKKTLKSKSSNNIIRVKQKSIAEYIKDIQNTHIFKNISEGVLSQCLTKIDEKRYLSNEIIISYNCESNEVLYLLIEGLCCMWIQIIN